MRHQATPLVFITTSSGCFVPLSHKLNPDGYFRKVWGTSAGKVYEMFHRFIWRAHHGDIPDGHEIDHTCKTRACCNVNHLRCIPGTQHAIETNETRYAARKALAKARWEFTRCTGTALAGDFGVSVSQACRWVREWVAH